VAVPYTGYYYASVHADITGGDNCGDAAGNMQLSLNGGNLATTSWNDWCGAGVQWGPGFVGAGSVFRSLGGSGRGWSSWTMLVSFIPTPNNTGN
jgi:hypothetical protein